MGMAFEEGRREILLQEYGYCNEQIGRLDDLIWQTAAVVHPVSLAGFAYFGATTTHTTDQFFALLAVAIGSATLLIIWYALCRLWFRFQTIAFCRMLEIETELGMWRFRYSSFMGRSFKQRQAALSKMQEDEQVRFEKLHTRLGNFNGIGLKAAAAYVALVFIVGWIALVLREYTLTFSA